MNILIADDELLEIELLTDFLKSLGTLKMATKKEQVSEFIAKEDFDIIFIDFLLPSLERGKILDIVKDKLKSMEIIYITPNTMVNEALLEIRTSGGDFVTKPLKGDDVKFAARKAFSRLAYKKNLSQSIPDDSKQAYFLQNLEKNLHAIEETHKLNEDSQRALEEFKELILKGSYEEIEKYSNALEGYMGEIKDVDKKKELQSTISLIIKSTKSVQKKNLEFQKKIEENQKEIEALKQNLEAAKKASTVDKLTGAYNRFAFDMKIKMEAERFLRYKTKFSLCMIDIDHFKKVNDTYGHQAGDMVLRAIADEIRKSTRKLDFVARYGGEELVVIFPNISLADAKIASEKIRESIQSTCFAYSGKTIRITVSMGLSEAREGDSPKEIIKRADMALYLSKESGRNRLSTEEDLK